MSKSRKLPLPLVATLIALSALSVLVLGLFAAPAHAATAGVHNNSQYAVQVNPISGGSILLRPGGYVHNSGGSFLVSKYNWCDWNVIGYTTKHRASANSGDVYQTYTQDINITACGTY